MELEDRWMEEQLDGGGSVAGAATQTLPDEVLLEVALKVLDRRLNLLLAYRT